MKKTTKVVLSVFAIAIASVFVSEYGSSANGNNSTPPTRTSGSPADNNCTNCHGPATTSYTTAVTSNIPSSGYISGQTYTVTIYVNAGTSKRFGFECSPQTTSATRTIIGSVAAMGTDQVNGTGYISHNGGQVGTSYTWQFKWTAPGSANQTAANATSNKANGNFYACIMIANNNGTNDFGDTPKQTNTAITENTTVSLTITASATTICSGTSVTFTANPTNEGTSPAYQWKVNGTATYTTTGTAYTTSTLNQGDVVTCVLTSSKTGVTSNPATSSNSITMTVNPTPSITGTTPAARCDAGTITLGATASSGTINWYAASGGGSSLQTGTSYTTPALSSTTTYYVDATTNNGCTSTPRITVTATVNNSPVVPTANSNSPVCEGDNILLNSSSSTSGVTYNWTGPNSFTSTWQNPPITAATQAMAGTYSVTASQNGCTSAAGTTTVIVNAPVTPSISIAVTAGSATSCAGRSITFTASATNAGSSPAYQWLVNNTAAPGINNAGTYVYNNFLNNDTVTCILTSNATCITTTVDTSNTIVITTIPVVTPSVSIAITAGSNPGCNGQTVTFTAVPINGGVSPNYQWQLNGSNVGTNQNTYSDSTLVNNDEVRCILTSNANCLTTATDTSAIITMSVNSLLIPAVSIAVAVGSTTICEGQSVQFNANPTNGGASPSYQWQLNGTNVGTDSVTYINPTLTNGQQITCTMTSSSGCATPITASSNTLTMVVTPTVIPSVTISGLNSICAGTTVTFTATATNSGLNPNYNWKINGATVQTGLSSTYSSPALSDNDVVSCILTPNVATCASPLTVSSNSLIMTVTSIANPTAAISITAGSNPSCTLQPAVTFSTTITDGGSAPIFQWQINGINAAGTNNDSTYTSSSLATNDTLTCILTSNAACATSSVVTSNKIGMTVTSAFTPSITISGSTSICEGQAVTFTAATYGGGQTPSYQWQVDGSPVGTDSPTYGPATPTNGQTIICILTSGSACASPTTVSSNTLTMVVTPTVVPFVSITSSSSVCAGTAVTFTATPNFGGSNPNYQWKLNNAPVGANSSIYTSPNNFTNNSVITCVLTSNAACANPLTYTATPITVSVTPVVNPSISIVQTSANPACSKDPVAFQALTNNQGSSPVYQWNRNGSPATGASNSNLYTSPSNILNNNDVITCVLTSNAICANGPATGTYTVTVATAVSPAIAITTSSTTVNAGTLVTFTATPTFGGSNPTYQWKVDGAFTGGINSSSYSTNSLTNGQVISCVLTSNISCVTQTTANSNNITMVITPTASPVPVTVTQTTTSVGVDLTSSAATGNQWYYNGVAIPGATGQTYTAKQNGVYYVIVTNSTISQSTPAGVAVPVSIAQSDNVLISSSASGNQWYLDGLLIPDSTGQTITVTQNGYYSVVATINGISSSATPVLINSFPLSPTTGINQIIDNNTITISPNPNDGNFRISLNVNTNATYSITIRDLLGQLIYGETLPNFSGMYDKKINLSGYGKGIYIISLTSPTFKTVNNVVVY